jgi:c-di-GMP-binding flagellar brake protein YcgR
MSPDLTKCLLGKTAPGLEFLNEIKRNPLALIEFTFEVERQTMNKCI